MGPQGSQGCMETTKGHWGPYEVCYIGVVLRTSYFMNLLWGCKTGVQESCKNDEGFLPSRRRGYAAAQRC